jgi:hypothetical protein
MSGVLDHLHGHGERVAVLTDTHQLWAAIRLPM